MLKVLSPSQVAWSVTRPLHRAILAAGMMAVSVRKAVMKHFVRQEFKMDAIAQLSQQIADREAKNIILDLPAQVLQRRVWRDVDKSDKPVHWEVKYLKLRGLLEVHPIFENLVCIKKV